jgi:hypothetical protein
MDPDEVYEARTLCDPDYWDALTRGEQIKAGACVAYMVRNGDLPLEFAECTCSGQKKYRRE